MTTCPKCDEPIDPQERVVFETKGGKIVAVYHQKCWYGLRGDSPDTERS